jgi:hypothetical protein
MQDTLAECETCNRTYNELVNSQCPVCAIQVRNG